MSLLSALRARFGSRTNLVRAKVPASGHPQAVKRRLRGRRAEFDRMVQANRDARKRWPIQERLNGALVQRLRLPEAR